MDNAAVELERYSALLGKDAVTRQQYDGVKTDYEAKKARYEMLSRQREATTSVVTETRERLSQTDAGIELTKSLLETAQLNLSYTVIAAPCGGYTSRKEIQTGQARAAWTDVAGYRREWRSVGGGKFQGDPDASYPSWE